MFSGTLEQIHEFTSFPESADDDTNQLIEKKEQNKPVSSYSFWQIEFYQKYFNVSTRDVLQRILSSVVPRLNNNYLVNEIKPNPDLYGPFWISITLIFTIAITGNIVNFFQNLGQPYTWTTDFHKVTSSAVVIILYWWCVPTLLFLLAQYRENKTEISFVEILCVYGYSLSILIPVSMLLVIQINILQWIFVALAFVLSGGVLVLTFFPVFSNDKINIYLPIMFMIFILHGLLTVGFMLYVVHVPQSHLVATTTATKLITKFQTPTNSTQL